jgi:hypothetical protein
VVLTGFGCSPRPFSTPHQPPALPSLSPLKGNNTQNDTCEVPGLDSTHLAPYGRDSYALSLLLGDIAQ